MSIKFREEPCGERGTEQNGIHNSKVSVSLATSKLQGNYQDITFFYVFLSFFFSFFLSFFLSFFSFFLFFLSFSPFLRSMCLILIKFVQDDFLFVLQCFKLCSGWSLKLGVSKSYGSPTRHPVEIRETGPTRLRVVRSKAWSSTQR